MAGIVGNQVRRALFSNKTKRSIEYLGISIGEYRKYLENLFEEGMTWDNFGEWQIDHIVPLMYIEDKTPPTEDVIKKRLHYTNTQPMWIEDNMRKGRRYIGSSKKPISQAKRF